MGATSDPVVRVWVERKPDETLVVAFPDLPWKFAVRTALVDGQPRLVAIGIEPNTNLDGELQDGIDPKDVVITAEALRSIPLAKIQAVVISTLKDDHDGLWAALNRVERQPGKAWDDDHYRLVADVYERAANLGMPALKAVQEYWGVKRSMASKHVRGARDRGFLGWPDKPGVQGTGKSTLEPASLALLGRNR